ncbi:MAG: hypothetical protein M1826_005332 [Phylliscum demangeonii]|nr:MAG: hypothetical protein M1826_005332 [Phylliscum demangeonii]
MAQFDDLAPSVGQNAVPLPYQSLRFGTFNYHTYNPTIDNLQPRSSPNYAFSGPRTQATAGQIPTIDFAYPGATLKSFDVKSFYYGCAAPTQVSTTVVLACTIQVTGTKAGTGAKVGPKLLNFAPPSVAGTGVATQSGLAFASFTDMTGLSSFTLQVVLSSVPAAQQQTTVIYLDDFVHTNYQ